MYKQIPLVTVIRDPFKSRDISLPVNGVVTNVLKKEKKNVQSVIELDTLLSAAMMLKQALC